MSKRIGIFLLAAAAIFAAAAAPAHAAFPGENGKIAYVQRAANTHDIWLLDPATGAHTQLTSGSQGDSDPSFSADGSRIVFVRTHYAYGGGNGSSNVWVMNADGTGQANVTNTGNSGFYSSPTWSPDGSKIAYAAYERGVFPIYVMNADGSGRVKIGEGTEPAWSPDGSTIAFTASGTWGSRVFLMNADGSSVRQLTSVRGYSTGHDSTPSWSPDGGHVAFVSTRSSGGEVWRVSVPGRVETRLTNLREGDNGNFPAWSPDGTKIVYQWGGLRLMNADGSDKQLLSADSWHSFADWGAVSVPVDSAPPSVSCGAPDDRWHADNVTIACTASDAGSGLADPADASFTLTTSVAAGEENPNAATGSRQVCDTSGNCTTAGPLTGIKIDRLAPTLTLPEDLAVDATSPAGAAAAYVATANDGADPAPAVACNPAPATMLAIGTTTIACTATDHAGNSSSGSFTIRVKGAAEQIADLIDKVGRLFGDRADKVQKPLDKTERADKACKSLDQFKQKIEKEHKTDLSDADRAELIADATRIRAVLGCA